MLFPSIRNVFSRSKGRTGPRSGLQAARPRLEQLEDRCVPAGFAVSAGGTGADSGLAVAADAARNVYVAGSIAAAGATFDAITHGVHVASAGGNDGFAAKYSPGGVLRWAVSVGGAYDDEATAIAVDPLGDVYVTGFINRTFQLNTSSTSVQIGAPLNQTVLPSAATAYYGNAFVVKLDTSGVVQWVKELDSNAYGISGTGIAVDSAGQAYVTGQFTGTVDFGQGHVLSTPTLAGNSFVIKLDAQGGTVWADQVTDTGGVGATGIALDGAGSAVYTIGGFQGHADFGGGFTLDTANASNGAIYIAKSTADGSMLWARAMAETPGTSGTGGTAIAVDDQGNAYMTGTFSGANVDFAPGAGISASQLTSNAGSLDVFVAKHDKDGNFIWAQRAGGAGADIGTSIAVDPAGTVYAGGFFSGQPGFFGSFFLPASGNGNSYIAELNPDGSVLSAVASQDLSPNADREFGLAVDNHGCVDITGAFGAQAQFDTMTKPGALPLLTSAGDNDIFVARLKPPRPPIEETVEDGHILQLTGDANLIAITDDRHWGIMVAVDGAAPLMFGPTIDKVVVTTGNANDAVRYTIGDPDLFNDPPGQPADLEVHLGGGSDTLLVDAANGEWPWGNSPVPWSIKVIGGAGNETSTFLLGGQMSSLDLEDLLGEKKNTVNLTYDPDTIPAAPISLNLNFAGTGGSDFVQEQIGLLQPPSPGDRAALEAAVNLHFAAGADPNPALSVEYDNVMIEAAQTLAMTGVQHDAALQMMLQNVVVSASLAVAFSSPGGDPGSTVGFNNVEHMPAPVYGGLTMAERSSPLGNDIRVIYDFNPQPEPPGMPAALQADVELHVPKGDPWSVMLDFVPQTGMAGGGAASSPGATGSAGGGAASSPGATGTAGGGAASTPGATGTAGGGAASTPGATGTAGGGAASTPGATGSAGGGAASTPGTTGTAGGGAVSTPGATGTAGGGGQTNPTTSAELMIDVGVDAGPAPTFDVVISAGGDVIVFGDGVEGETPPTGHQILIDGESTSRTRRP
jgi:hypothetical protein